MKGITVKLPEETLRRLKEEAQSTGRSVASLIRERIGASKERDTRTVYSLTEDLAGSVSGRRKAATNQRARFRRG